MYVRVDDIILRFGVTHLEVEVVIKFSGMQNPARFNKSLII